MGATNTIVKQDHWSYGTNEKGRSYIFYVIDGEKMRKYEAVEHLMEKRGMTQEEAFNYLDDEIEHL